MVDVHTHTIAGNGSIRQPEASERTLQFYEELKARQARIPRPNPIPSPTPLPIPALSGSRFMVWKQDPSVGELGRRLSFIPGFLLNGPRDLRISTELPGTTPVVRNIDGDFVFSADTPESDCAHTFAVIRQTLTMYEHHRNGTSIPWAWNAGGNVSPIGVFPRGFQGANAFYSRNQQALKFGSFMSGTNSREVFTCRSLDIVAHECGHAILDGLKPGWLGFGNPPQTGGLHEAFGDLTAIFLAMSQLDQVEAFIAVTRANLHAKNFLAALAEEFGIALGMPIGLRNADNDLKLSQVSNEVHAIAQVFTGGIYDIMADIFAFERARQAINRSPARVLFEVSHDLSKLVLDAIIASPNVGATYSDVVNQMLTISKNQGDPPIYRTFIRNRFSFRDVVVSPTPLEATAMACGTIPWGNPDFTDEEGQDPTHLQMAHPEHPSLRATPDFSGTCGTMQLPEYALDHQILEAGLERLRKTGEPMSEMDLLAEEQQKLMKLFSQ